MKKKSVLISIVFLCMIFLGMGNVNAANLNDLTINVQATTGSAGAQVNVKIDGALDPSGVNYYAKFVNQGDPKPVKPSNWSVSSWTEPSGQMTSTNFSPWLVVSSNGQINVNDNWFFANGYDYVYILECSSSTCNMTDNPIKADRPQMPNLSQRYHIYFLDNNISIYTYFPCEDNDFEVKIGLLDDNNILKSLSNNVDGALNSLLEYAKNAQNGTTFKLNYTNNKVPFTGFDVKEGAYYYVYTSSDTKNGVLQNVEDITVMQGFKDSNGNIVMSNDIIWDVNGNILNPKTGEASLIIVVLIALFAIAFIIFAKKRLKKSN